MMSEGLDIALDHLKKLDGYGVTKRLLSTTQNLPSAVLILNTIMDLIKENGGAPEFASVLNNGRASMRDRSAKRLRRRQACLPARQYVWEPISKRRQKLRTAGGWQRCNQ